MKKIAYLCMTLGLGLSSCEKEENVKKDAINEETFVLNGETFSVSEVKALTYPFN